MTAIDLKKKAGIVLEKRGARDVKARTGAAIDVSGSMQPLYQKGVVQETMARFFGLAMNLDDNAELDAWTFDNQVSELPSVTQTNHQDFVRMEILRGEVSKWGGTNYAPPLLAAKDHWFPQTGFFARLLNRARPASGPALLLFGTDGENQDPAEARAALDAVSAVPLYVQFIGIGGRRQDFPFLNREADRRPNVGFVAIPNITSISVEDLYEEVVTQEMADWLKRAAV